MTLPYCCHIISKIEIEHSSSSNLPKWVIYSFENPRINSIANNYGDSLIKSTKPKHLNELYSICDSFLRNFGHSMKSIQNDNGTDEVPLAIGDKTERSNSSQNEDHSSSSNNSDFDPTLELPNFYNLNNLKSDEILKTFVQNLITKSMVYYLSLYEKFSKNYDLLKISNKSFAISKNSNYEMITGLKDCLFQLRESKNRSNEAIIITNDYSGIFSENDVLITRSSLSFRHELRVRDICYRNVYDEIALLTGSKVVENRSDKNCSKVVNSYLKNSFKNENRGKRFSEAQFESQDKIDNVSKFNLLKSLKLPISDDYDINFIRIKGKNDCNKLFKLLEDDCINALLPKKHSVFSNIRLILTNFPILFSKVNQARFNITQEYNVTKMSIKGLIMPSSLMTSLNLLKLLQSREMLSEAAVKIEYNLTFDNEMYEKSLRIRANKIYDNFLNNFTEIKRTHSYTYKALKRLIPFKAFNLQKGNLKISLPKSELYQTIQGDFTLSLCDKQYSSGDDQVQIYEDSPANLVIVKDTLYHNLGKLKSYLNIMEGTGPIITYSIKSFLDEGFSSILYTKLEDEDNYSKCYIDLYPNRYTDVVCDVKIMPYNLVSVIWILSYILHFTGRVNFWDQKALENVLKYDIYQLNVEESETQDEIFIDKFRITKTLNFPLSQQSYFIHLVHNIEFNRDFSTKFKINYMEYRSSESVNVKSKEAEKVQVVEQVLSLSSGWKSLLNDKDSKDDQVGEDREVRREEVVKIHEEMTGNKRLRSDDVLMIKNKFKIFSGTVDSSFRKYGRVHHCNFNFDSDTKFQEILDKSVQNFGNELIPKQSHYIIIFLFSNSPTIMELVHLKFLKNVLNSNLIKFSNNKLNSSNISSDLTNPNVNQFISSFESQDFATGSKILNKNSVSYSILSSDFDINELYSILNQVNEMKVDIISIPLIQDDLNSCSKSVEKIMNSMIRVKSDFNVGLDFVNISFIFDSYFTGLLNLDSIPEEYKLYLDEDNTQYSLENFSIQDFKQKSQCDWEVDDLVDMDLKFKQEYKGVKYFWGWNVYVLMENEHQLSQDCILYRKHCGIKMSMNRLEEVKEKVEKDIEDNLSRFNISSQDIEKYLFYNKILINSVILSSQGSMGGDDINTVSCVNPTIGEKKICFGPYDGIPILNTKWFLNKLECNIN